MKLFCLVRFIIIKAALFIYKYILYPVYWFFAVIFAAVLSAIKFILNAVWKAVKFIIIKAALFFKNLFKFLYQSLLIIIFLPLLTLYYLILTFITAPYIVYKIEIPILSKSIEIPKIKRVLMHPAYILKSRRISGIGQIEIAKKQKNESIGLIRIKHYCGLVTVFIWSVLLYLLNCIILSVKK